MVWSGLNYRHMTTYFVFSFFFLLVNESKYHTVSLPNKVLHTHFKGSAKASKQTERKAVIEPLIVIESTQAQRNSVFALNCVSHMQLECLASTERSFRIAFLQPISVLSLPPCGLKPRHHSGLGACCAICAAMSLVVALSMNSIICLICVPSSVIFSTIMYSLA